MERGSEWTCCCCSLLPTVQAVAVTVASLHLAAAATATSLYCFHLSTLVGEAREVDRVKEIGSLEEAYSTQLSLPSPPPVPSFPAFPLLLATLALALPGFIFSLLVIRGAMRSAPRLLLPWLVIQVLVILSCLAGGLYLVIAFTLISKERDLSRACAGLGPIGLAVLLILLWLPVDQLYIRLKRSSALVIELTPGLRRSQSKLSCSTLASARSLSTIGGKKHQQRGAMLKSRSRTSVVSSRLLNKDLMAERSRSLELILSSQGSSSPTPPGSLLFPAVHPGTQTLPRLRPCREAPGTFSAGPTWKATDTLRSCRSLASVKSVSIHPEVTEYRYKNGGDSELVDGPLPGVEWLTRLGERRRGLTKDQIIDIYCTQADVAL